MIAFFNVEAFSRFFFLKSFEMVRSFNFLGRMKKCLDKMEKIILNIKFGGDLLMKNQVF